MTLPNQLTVLRIILTPVALYFLLKQDPQAKYIAAGVFIIASLTDWYDGHFARKYGYVSKWGKFLDPFADKILISTMLIGFVMLKYLKFGWVIAIVCRDLIITVLRGYMIAFGKPISANLVAKWKTFSQVILVYLMFIYLILEIRYGADLASMKVFIDNYLEFVALFTIATGLVYLYEHRSPLTDLIRRFYKMVVPF